MLYTFFWVIPPRLNSDAGELPRKKHTTFRTWQKIEIRDYLTCLHLSWSNITFLIYSTNILAQHTSCWVGLWDGLLKPDGQWCSPAGDSSWISSGCTNSRPFLMASCTSSGCTAMLSSFWRFGRARSTVSRYLQTTMELNRLHPAIHAIYASYCWKMVMYQRVKTRYCLLCMKTHAQKSSSELHNFSYSLLAVWMSARC